MTAQTAKTYWRYPNPIPHADDLIEIDKFKKIAAISALFLVISAAAALGVYFHNGSYYAAIPAAISVIPLLSLMGSWGKATKKPRVDIHYPLTVKKLEEKEHYVVGTFNTILANIHFSNYVQGFQSTDTQEFITICFKDKVNLQDQPYPNPANNCFLVLPRVEYSNKTAYLEEPNYHLHQVTQDLAKAILPKFPQIVIFPEGCSDGKGHRISIHPPSMQFARQGEFATYKNTDILPYYYETAYVAFKEVKSKFSCRCIHVPIPGDARHSTRALVSVYMAAAKMADVDLFFYSMQRQPYHRWEPLGSDLLDALEKDFANDKTFVDTLNRIESKTDTLWFPLLRS